MDGVTVDGRVEVADMRLGINVKDWRHHVLT